MTNVLLAAALATALALIVAGAILSGCAPLAGAAWTDGRFYFVNVKSAADIAGGPRQDLLLIVDKDGEIVRSTVAEAVGTLQAVASGIGAAVISAGGQAAGSALIRPARNTTNVQMEVQGTGGSGGAGGSNTVSGTGGSAMSTGSTATSSSTTTGVVQP